MTPRGKFVASLLRQAAKVMGDDIVRRTPLRKRNVSTPVLSAWPISLTRNSLIASPTPCYKDKHGLGLIE